MRASLTGLIAAALAVATVAAPHGARAFKPDDRGHLGITQSALASIGRTIDGEVVRFSDRAINEIRQANKDSDCIACQLVAAIHFDDERLTAASERLANLADAVVVRALADPPRSELTRRLLGAALHTVQDFYSHSNWIERENLGINATLGVGVIPDTGSSVVVCRDESSLLPGAALTTGYFQIPALCGAPGGKCRHGVPTCSSGLNKDSADRPFHDIARAMADTATRRFVDQILDDPRIAGNAKAISALMDAGRAGFGVAIDQTGSMGEELPILKQQVRAAVSALVSSPDGGPRQWVLVPLDSAPKTAQVFGRGEHEAFLAAVDALTAGGGGSGGGCAVSIYGSYLSAIEALRPGSTLWGFTDASPFDPELAPAVIGAAKAKDIAVTHLLTGSCVTTEQALARARISAQRSINVIDPSYAEVAQATGGLSLELAAADLSAALDQLRFSEPENTQEIHTVRAVGRAQPIDVSVPIDSTVSRFSVLLAPRDSPPAADQFDHFRVALASSDVIRIEVRAERLGSPLDAVLRIYDGSGAQQLAANDDWLGRDPRIDFTPPGAGTYVVRVESAVGSDVAGQLYKLQIGTPGGGSILEDEPNDLPEDAQELPVGTTVSGILGTASMQDLVVELVDPRGALVPLSDQDRDLFEISGAAGDVLDAEVRAERDGTTADPVLRLLASDGVTIVRQNDDFHGLDPRIEHTLPSAGVYLLEVSDARRRTSETGSYTLVVRRNGVGSSVSSGEVEPNDGTSVATPLSFPGTLAGAVSVRGVRFNDGTRFDSLDAPVPGLWTARVSGPAAIPYTLSIRGVTPIVATEAAVVELGGRPGHEGLFSIPGDPIVGQAAQVLAGLVGPWDSTSFALVDASDLSVVAAATPSGSEELAGDEEHVLTTVIPGAPFRTRVTGLDQQGFAYQRLYSREFVPQLLSVSVSGEGISIRRGGTRTVRVVVHNYGPDGEFALDAASSLGSLAILPELPVEIASGEEALFVVTFSVPSDAPEDAMLQAVIQAMRTDDPTAVNSALVGLALRDGNERPVAFDGSHATSGLDPIDIALVATDGDGDPLVFSLLDQPQKGTLSGSGTLVSYVPEPGQFGTDSFRFVASDGESTSLPATITVAHPPEPFCGDGLLNDEACDDGGLAAGDGCSSSCTVEPGWSCSDEPSVCMTVCGDTMIAGDENCDDGDTSDGDGCSGACAIEIGWECVGTPSSCTTICSDGLVTTPETCDDGDRDAGDGCGVSCAIEAGWACSGAPSSCNTICGDTTLVGSETCDDGDASDGDGCSAACAIEPGWECVGTPSSCTTICSDGLVTTPETCDDGDLDPGDGCGISCNAEAGWICSGTPSACRTTCGDGVRAGDEACDDSGTDSGDGCSAMCDVELFLRLSGVALGGQVRIALEGREVSVQTFAGQSASQAIEALSGAILRAGLLQFISHLAAGEIWFTGALTTATIDDRGLLGQASPSVEVVPEAGSLALGLSAMAGLAALARWRSSRPTSGGDSATSRRFARSRCGSSGPRRCRSAACRTPRRG